MLMITGVVTAASTAVIPLQLQGSTGHQETLPTIVDTGFTTASYCRYRHFPLAVK
jgi:hypothetical protein